MPVIDTAQLRVLEKRPGWRGRLIHSANNTFAYWEFDAGSDKVIAEAPVDVS